MDMETEDVTNLLKRARESTSETASDNAVRGESTFTQVDRSKSSKRSNKKNKITNSQNKDNSSNQVASSSTASSNRFEILSSTRLSDDESGEIEESLTYDKHYVDPYLVLAKYKIGNKRLSAFEAARKLTKANVKYNSLEDYSYNSWKLIFKSRSAANSSLSNKFLKEQELTTFVPRFKLLRKGVINRIPLDVLLDELKTVIEEENFRLRINKLFRLKRKDKESRKWIDSSSVCIEFKTCSKQEVCLNCASHHPRDAKKPCTENSKCVNCELDHKVFDHNCPVLKRRREIASTMAYRNIPFFEARRLVDKGYSPPPSPSPSQSTTQPSSSILSNKTQGSSTTNRISFADAVKDAAENNKSSGRESLVDTFPIFSKLESDNFFLLKGLATLAQILLKIPEANKKLSLFINRLTPEKPSFNHEGS